MTETPAQPTREPSPVGPPTDAPASPTPPPPPSPPTPAAAPASRSRGAWLVLIGVALAALAADLVSKQLAFAHVARGPVVIHRADVLEVGREDPHRIETLVPDHGPMVVVPSVLEFRLVLNPGAVFGIGPGQRWFFVGFTLIALTFGLVMFARWTGPRDRFAHAALGLLIGGGLGNLYDRIVYACVRDFIHPLPGAQWPFGWRIMGSRELWPYVSNVADLLLLIGIAMLLVHLWRHERQNGADADEGGPTRGEMPAGAQASSDASTPPA